MIFDVLGIVVYLFVVQWFYFVFFFGLVDYGIEIYVVCGLFFEYLDVMFVVFDDMRFVFFEVFWYVVSEGIWWFDCVVIDIDENQIFNFYCCFFFG